MVLLSFPMLNSVLKRFRLVPWVWIYSDDNLLFSNPTELNTPKTTTIKAKTISKIETTTTKTTISDKEVTTIIKDLEVVEAADEVVEAVTTTAVTKEAEAVDTDDTTTTITTILATTKVTVEITTNHHKTTMVEILVETTIFKLNLHHLSNNNT